MTYPKNFRSNELTLNDNTFQKNTSNLSNSEINIKAIEEFELLKNEIESEGVKVTVFKDERDGYSYPTVIIGSQCWMAENLRYVIPGSSEVLIPSGGVASQLDNGFVYTGIDYYNLDGNGRYYSWGSAAGAVPYAWHLPTAEEFETLLLNYNGIDLQSDGQTEFNAQISGQLTISEGIFEYIQNITFYFHNAD